MKYKYRFGFQFKSKPRLNVQIQILYSSYHSPLYMKTKTGAHSYKIYHNVKIT